MQDKLEKTQQLIQQGGSTLLGKAPQAQEAHFQKLLSDESVFDKAFTMEAETLKNQAENSLYFAQSQINKLQQTRQTIYTQAQEFAKLKAANPYVATITDKYIKQTLENPLKEYQTLDTQGKEALKQAFAIKFKTAQTRAKIKELGQILMALQKYDDELAQNLKTQGQDLDLFNTFVENGRIKKMFSSQVLYINL